jgi:ribosome-binding factor A
MPITEDGVAAGEIIHRVQKVLVNDVDCSQDLRLALIFGHGSKV